MLCLLIVQLEEKSNHGPPTLSYLPIAISLFLWVWWAGCLFSLATHEPHGVGGSYLFFFLSMPCQSHRGVYPNWCTCTYTCSTLFPCTTRVLLLPLVISLTRFFSQNSSH